jgi:nucleoside-diphosphate-sugar epimerase
MINFYLKSLEYDSNLINGQVFNVGYENLKIKDIALLVKKVVKKNFQIETTSSNDNRSYRITSKKIEKILNFRPEYTVEDAIQSLYESFKNGIIINPFNSKFFFNVEVMKSFYDKR